MTDRLKEIKARYTDMESWVLHTMDHVVVDHDIAWLIQEVERLRELVMETLADGLKLGAEIERIGADDDPH